MYRGLWGLLRAPPPQGKQGGGDQALEGPT